MLKTEAIEKLGGTNKSAALAIGISVQAISQWPETLPPRIADRVIAALSRMPRRIKPEAVKPEKASA
jgi:hypothetical protein